MLYNVILVCRTGCPKYYTHTWNSVR